jgi:hypothetical protein
MSARQPIDILPECCLLKQYHVQNGRDLFGDKKLLCSAVVGHIAAFLDSVRNQSSSLDLQRIDHPKA